MEAHEPTPIPSSGAGEAVPSRPVLPASAASRFFSPPIACPSKPVALPRNTAMSIATPQHGMTAVPFRRIFSILKQASSFQPESRPLH